jgi:hypothetical protein
MSKSCLYIIKSILIAVKIIIKLYMEYVWTLLIGPVLGSSHLIDHVSDSRIYHWTTVLLRILIVFIVLELFIIADYKS